MSESLDKDLSTLAPEDLRRVCRWVEDRMVNAIHPLAIQLQLHQVEMLGQVEMLRMMPETRILQAADRAVEMVLAAVEEIRELAGEQALDLSRAGRQLSLYPAGENQEWPHPACGRGPLDERFRQR